MRTSALPLLPTRLSCPDQFRAALHAVLSTTAAAAEIPAILRGEKPSSSDPEAAEFGSHDYGKKVVAIVVGGGYGEVCVRGVRGCAVAYE